jgi:hypothetical protein
LLLATDDGPGGEVIAPLALALQSVAQLHVATTPSRAAGWRAAGLAEDAVITAPETGRWRQWARAMGLGAPDGPLAEALFPRMAAGAFDLVHQPVPAEPGMIATQALALGLPVILGPAPGGPANAPVPGATPGRHLIRLTTLKADAGAIWLPAAAVAPETLPAETWDEDWRPLFLPGAQTETGVPPGLPPGLLPVSLAGQAPPAARSLPGLALPGTPAQALAAMAQGHVVIVPATGDWPDLVTPDVGLLVAPGERWQDRAAPALRLPDRLQHMGRAAAARVRAHHSWAARARQYAAIHAFALGERADPPLFFSESHPILSLGFDSAQDESG